MQLQQLRVPKSKSIRSSSIFRRNRQETYIHNWQRKSFEDAAKKNLYLDSTIHVDAVFDVL